MSMIPSRKIARLYIIFLLLAGSLLFASCILVINLQYDSLIQRIVVTMKKNGLEQLLRNRAFTLQKFDHLQKTAYVLLFLLPLMVFCLITLKNKIIRAFRFVLRSIRLNVKDLARVFQSNTKKQNRLFFGLLALIALRSIYYILNHDLQYDEMWSYNYFTAQPFYYSFFMYNNYPLYEITTGFFKWLPFPMKINLRLPVWIAGLIACVVLYACLKAYFKDQRIALAGTVSFAFFPVATCYMLYGRGVMFEILFACIALFSVAFWLRDQERSDRLAIYAIANTAGIYAMPTHIYLWILFMVLTVIIGRPVRGPFKKFLYANAFVALGVLLCYLPIALGSGFSFLSDSFNNQDSFAHALTNLVPYIERMGVFVCGSRFGIYGGLIICIILLNDRKNIQQDFLLWLIVGIFALPLLCYVFQRFFIPERAFGFIALTIPLLTALLLNRLIESMPKRNYYGAIAILGVTGILISHFHNMLNWSKNLDKKALEISGILLANHVQTCYDNTQWDAFTYNYPAVEYYYRLEHKAIQFTVNGSRSIRYKPFSPSDHYDCIILTMDNKDAQLLKDYRIVYEDPVYNYKILVSIRI